MCLAVPAQIVEAQGTRAKVELSGNVLDADLSLIEDAVVGEWVLVHAGFAIEKLSPEDAQQALDLILQLQDATDAIG